MEITWLPAITLTQIKGAVSAFADPNTVHADTHAAQQHFGDEAIGPVAPGALIVGVLGGEIARLFGHGTVAHRINDLTLCKCFCSGDSLGYVLDITGDKPRFGKRFVQASIQLYRMRNATIVEASRGPVRLEIVCPIAAS